MNEELLREYTGLKRESLRVAQELANIEKKVLKELEKIGDFTAHDIQISYKEKHRYPKLDLKHKETRLWSELKEEEQKRLVETGVLKLQEHKEEYFVSYRNLLNKKDSFWDKAETPNK